MSPVIKILIVEDNESDADLAVRELRRAGFNPVWQLVDNEQDYLTHLDPSLDLIISDYGMPSFSGMRALELRNQRVPTLPFIVVSGVIGEDFAVKAMQEGATDYILKDRLARLGTAVRNALEQNRLRGETQRATAALQESEELFSKAFKLSPDGMLIFRIADRTILRANDAACCILGVSAEELIGKPKDNFVRWLSLAERNVFMETVQTRGEYRNYETSLQLINGRTHWFNLSSRLINVGGEPCMLSVLSDITERRQSEEKLRASEERFRAAFEHAEMGMILVSLERAFLRVNDAFCRITGYSASELLAMSTRDITYPDDVEADATQVQALLRGVAPRSSVEKRYLRKNGEPVWVALTISLVRRADGTPDYFVGLVEDLSQRRNLEAQLRQAQKMEAIGQLAGGVAHDFNNMLTAIMGHAALLEMRGALAPEAKADLKEINDAAERAARLTQQLLLFSRREAIQPIALNLNDSVTALAKMLQRLMGEDVRLHLRLHSRPLIVNADRGMIDQVLMNLAINARDAMPRGGELIIETAAQTIEAAAEPGAELEPGAHACIRVSDTGMGIPAEVLPRIFEPFFTTKEVGKGTGLGLATVFGIVKQHRGAVRVSSEPGRGTTFRVLLPLSREALKSQAAESRAAPRRGRGETVLLIEDDMAVQRMTKHSLEQAGYRVVAATNGPAALHAWERLEGKVDLLLSDLVLPGGSTGDEIALRFRASRPDLPVILMSGYSAKGIDSALNSSERLVFLQKPFEVASLLTHIQQLLHARA